MGRDHLFPVPVRLKELGEHMWQQSRVCG